MDIKFLSNSIHSIMLNAIKQWAKACRAYSITNLINLHMCWITFSTLFLLLMLPSEGLLRIPSFILYFQLLVFTVILLISLVVPHSLSIYLFPWNFCEITHLPDITWFFHYDSSIFLLLCHSFDISFLLSGSYEFSTQFLSAFTSIFIDTVLLLFRCQFTLIT